MSTRPKTGRVQRPPRIASCEPCRLSKLACDHRRPCSRCVSRDTTNGCVYRKNAFKRISSARSTSSPRLLQPRPVLVFDPPSVPETTEPALPVNLYPNPGFQGSSSLNTVLDNLRQQTTLLGDVEPNPGPSSAVRDEERPNPPVARSIDNAVILEGVRLLDVLLSWTTDDVFGRLFFTWKGNGLESHVGAFLVWPFIDTITRQITRLQNSQDLRSGLLALSQRLFETSSRPLDIHRSMTLQDFVDQYTGPNLRWETVGVIVSLAGIAVTEIRAPHSLYGNEKDRQALRTQMVHLGSTCVSFCESLDALNDVQVIFLYQTFQLESVFYGDQSFKTWRRLNDAVGALLAAGLHENVQEGQKVPFFLVELRKRICARLYGIDSTLAAFVGRPPRMSKRFCCISLPLDIGEDTYFLAGEALDRELRMLDENGWNTQGHIRPTAVMRWSMITAMIREDTLELMLGQNIADMHTRLSALRREINDSWNNLPRHLAGISSHDLWVGERRRQETECLHMIRLSYLQTVFLIEWAAWRHGMEPSPSLFRAASDLLSWVNEALVRREHLPCIGFISLAWRVASCALPAAGALAICSLQRSSSSRRTGFKHLDAQSRRRTMENLSVLIAHMDILHSPHDGNFQLFSQAKRSLQSVMDILLQPAESTQLETSPTSATQDLSSIDWMVSDYCGFSGGFWVNFPDCLYMGDADGSMPQREGFSGI